MQYALRLGAIVYATAGKDEKQEYLRGLGVKFVTSTRNGDLFEADMAKFLGDEAREVGCPTNQTEQEYAEWMELKLDDNPMFTIIAPFEKKYVWCVVWLEGVEGCPANMCATAPGTKGRFCSKPSRSRAASY